MAQEQSALNLPGIAVDRSVSDRPKAIRMTLNTLRFLRTKPLGAIGLVLIVLPVAAAALAGQVSRYDPNTEFYTPNKEFRADLFELSLSDPLMKIKHLLPDGSIVSASEAQGVPGAVSLAAHPEYFTKGQIAVQNAPSSGKHWLGTDGFSHDLYSRIIYGARLSLLVGIGGAIIACFFGTVFGVVSGYFGGWVDMLIQRVTDAFFAFPSLILLLLFVQVVEKPTKYHITLALGIVGISQVVRIVRSSVLAAREEVYVSAARTIGASDVRIMARHILPNILAPLIVVFTISIGAYILAEAGLQFIGLGDPTEISWGKMVNEGRGLGASKPLMALWTGLAITVTVLGFNLFGDALRDALDPRLRGRGARAGF